MINNNTPNFAPEGNIVGEVPSGSGIMVMANSHVEIFENRIENNGTTGIAVISYADDYEDKSYYPHPRSIQIHNNEYINNGKNPDIESNDLARLLFELSNAEMPDIFWDGVVPVSQMFFGQNQEDKMIIDEDSSPSIITLDPIKYILPLLDPVKRDINEFSGNIKPLQAVKLNEVL